MPQHFGAGVFSQHLTESKLVLLRFSVKIIQPTLLSLGGKHFKLLVQEPL